jgi:hypothetical protein
MPFAFIVARASGLFKKSRNAVTASLCFAPIGLPADVGRHRRADRRGNGW